VGSPHTLEFKLGLAKEAVVSLIESASDIVGSSFAHKASIIRIERSEGVTELREAESAIVVFIVSLDEKFKIFNGWENADVVETCLKI
jgi:hypothetical protein